MTWLHNKFPDKHVYFTEGSTFDIPGAVEIISYFRNWARCYNAWVTVIDHKTQPNQGPHDCSPTCIVLNSKTLELEYRFDYYMYGHFMKYIKRGAVRIESTPSKTLPNVAFKNPDGSIVLIMVNPTKKTQQFTIGWGIWGLTLLKSSVQASVMRHAIGVLHLQPTGRVLIFSARIATNAALRLI